MELRSASPQWLEQERGPLLSKQQHNKQIAFWPRKSVPKSCLSFQDGIFQRDVAAPGDLADEKLGWEESGYSSHMETGEAKREDAG